MNDLATEAAALDAESSGQASPSPEAAAGQGTAPEPQTIDYVPMLAGTLDTAAFALEPLYPFVRKHYHHDQNVAIAHAVVDLCDAYNLDLEKLLGKLLLWLNLVTVVGMPALGCIAEVRARQAASSQPPNDRSSPTSSPEPLDQNDPANHARMMTGEEFASRRQKKK